MLFDPILARKIATDLLQIKAIKLEPQTPFTWASGLRSPIYCDNRSSLSYPEIRNRIKDGIAAAIRSEFSEGTAIVGVATAGIAHGALAADKLNMPFAYVRSKPKEHGMGNQIEGRLEEGSKVIVIEDLVSTGKSSLSAVNALREAGFHVVGMISIFTYGLAVADAAFKKNDCKLITLSDYSAMLDVAVESNYINKLEQTTLSAWREDPEHWFDSVEK